MDSKQCRLTFLTMVFAIPVTIFGWDHVLSQQYHWMRVDEGGKGRRFATKNEGAQGGAEGVEEPA